VAESLRTRGLAAQIKWPNDVLINGGKMCGILVESVWSGEEVDCVVLGVGVNVLKESVPPAEGLLFPATSLEEELGQPPSRVEVLSEILGSFLSLRPRLTSDELVSLWQSLLAFQGKAVEIESTTAQPMAGRISGLNLDGSLQLLNEHGEIVTVRFGDVRLRPLT
jgi:BirA family biotin operon repressor/biotin-[acetyl-CoA-carboxylase] ligase